MNDLDLINGYLDHEMTDQEMMLFAERLSREESLKNDLAETLQVKRLLHELPTQKPPRNYTLTRAMAMEHRKASIWERLFPAFRTAAVFACLGLMFTFIFPFLNTANSAAPAAMSAEPNYSAKALPAEIAAEEAAPEISFQNVSADPSVTENYSSKGVRGGNPKLEYLVTAQRVLPDDRSQASPAESERVLDLAVSANETAGTAGLSAQQEIQQMLRDSDQSIGLAFSPEFIAQLILLAVLLVSVIWISITLFKRRILI